MTTDIAECLTHIYISMVYFAMTLLNKLISGYDKGPCCKSWKITLLVTIDYAYTACICKILEFLHAFLKHGEICK